jgi:hypothetical protein
MLHVQSIIYPDLAIKAKEIIRNEGATGTTPTASYAHTKSIQSSFGTSPPTA